MINHTENTTDIVDVGLMFDELKTEMATFTDNVIRIADHYNMDRDELLKTCINTLEHMISIGTFEHYEVKQK